MSTAAETNAATALLNHLSMMSDADLQRVDTDYIDYAPDAHYTVALFEALNPSKDTNYLDLMPHFAYALLDVAKNDEDQHDVSRFCVKLFSALLRFEISQR